MICSCGNPIPKREGKGRQRARCDGCWRLLRRQRALARLKKHRERRQRKVRERRRGWEALHKGEAVATRPTIAAVVGAKDKHQVIELERRALAKLREHPLYQEVREAFLDWVRAGKPRPPKRDPGDVLLEHQAQVAALYEQYEGLLPVAPEAANEILDEIEKYQKKLGEVRDELLRLKYE